MEEVLQLLAGDARLTAAQIAERVGRTEEEVARAIQRLEKSGVIRRYKTVIDWEKAGTERVYGFIEVRVSPERGVGFDAVAERIMQFPEVHSLYLMSGTYDLLVVVEGKGMREVAFFVAEKLAPLDHVLSTATHFVLKSYKVDGDVLVERSEVKRLPVTP
ncbi:MAG: Lrp/AsnC family transcriptional regulator [Armatimonadota bacterium]|jgi:DNA-binding Lrp family transcriptional regulator